MMKIQKFTEKSLSEAGVIAKKLWEDEIKAYPERMLTLLYEYLVRFYFVPESPYNAGVFDGEKLCAFLLASPHENTGERRKMEADRLLSKLISGEEIRAFGEYRNYLESNTLAEERIARPGEIEFLLFGSIRPGCGKMLLEHFESLCRADNVQSTILWTDETCDFDYYDRRGFRRIADFLNQASLCGKNHRTWIFRKEF